MKILHGERGTGKSIKCLDYAWITNSVIVCATYHRKARLQEEAKKWDMQQVEIVCISELETSMYGNHKTIIIDDVEDILHNLFKCEDIILATTSCEIRELPKGDKE